MAWFKKTQGNSDPNLLRPRGAENCLKDIVFVRTGELIGLSEDQLKTYISILGGKMTGSVSGKTSFLIMGENPGQTKQDAARNKNVPIISEEQFYDLIEMQTKKLFNIMAPRSNYTESLKPISKSEIAELGGCKQKQKDELIDLDEPTEPAESTELDTEIVNSDSTPWVDKYKPTNCSTFIGNKSALDELRISLQKPNFAIFVYGAIGVGKSLAVELICKELELEPFFITSSIQRTKLELQRLLDQLIGRNSIFNYVKTASQNQILYKKHRVIVLDEAEAIDAGGLPFLNKYIEKIRNQGNDIQIIFIAQEYTQKLQTIMKKSVQVQFRRTPKNIIIKYLLGVLEKEGIKLKNPSQLDILCDRANGDLRRIINGLQFQMQNLLAFEKLQLPQEFVDLTNGVFSFARFRSNTSNAFYTLIDGYFQDNLLQPSLIQNYPAFSSFDMDYMIEAADILSLSDTITHQQYSRGDWRASRAMGVLGCTLGLIGGNYRISHKGFIFPSFPSCISIANIQKSKYQLKQEFDISGDCCLYCDCLILQLDCEEIDPSIISMFRGAQMYDKLNLLTESYEMSVVKGVKRKSFNLMMKQENEELIVVNQSGLRK